MSPLTVGFVTATIAALVVTRVWGQHRLRWSWAMLTVSWLAWSAGDVRVPIFAAALATWVRFMSTLIISGRWPHMKKVAVCVVLGGFAVTRAGPQLIELISTLWGGGSPNRWWFVVGASFAVFQSIMFIVDADRLERPPTWLEAALAVALLPKALAGPLVRPEKLLNELRTWPRPVLDLRPAFLLTGAAVAKIYVAGEIIQRFVYADAGGTALISGWDSILQKVAGPVMFWANVSALADLAVAGGIAIGIRLPQNFDAPLGARNLAELWRRWHVTVSAFFRDYVLRPFTGANPSPLRLTVGLVAVMTLSGFWHGYTVFTAMWGTVNGVVLAWLSWRQRRQVSRRIAARRGGAIIRRKQTPWWGLPATLTFFSLISPLLSNPGWDDFHPTLTSMFNLTAHPQVDLVTMLVLVVTTVAAAGGWRPWQRLVHGHLTRIPAVIVAAWSAVVVTASFGFANGAQPAFLYLGVW